MPRVGLSTQLSFILNALNSSESLHSRTTIQGKERLLGLRLRVAFVCAYNKHKYLKGNLMPGQFRQVSFQAGPVTSPAFPVDF